jgi:hypothetical protein
MKSNERERLKDVSVSCLVLLYRYYHTYDMYVHVIGLMSRALACSPRNGTATTQKIYSMNTYVPYYT